jgi:acetyl-CoA carboxylase beta subunit
LEKSLRVCSACGHHFRVPARERIAQLVDEGTFTEADASLISLDPIVFSDSTGYPERAAAARASSLARNVSTSFAYCSCTKRKVASEDSKAETCAACSASLVACSSSLASFACSHEYTA